MVELRGKWFLWNAKNELEKKITFKFETDQLQIKDKGNPSLDLCETRWG